MNVYVCVTLYHVYITLLFVFLSGNNKENNIIFLNANNEIVYKQYLYIAQQLKMRGYICDVRLKSFKDEIFGREIQKNKKQLKIVESCMKVIEEKDFTLINFAWNNSYVYPAAGLLYKKAKEAIFVEESTLIAMLKQEKKWKKVLHRILGDCVDFYKDSKIREIMVQKPETFPEEWQNKLSILDVARLSKKLNKNDAYEIIEIMSQEGVNLFDILQETNIGIVYTCPFSEQNIISEEEKIKQILLICNHYKKYGKCILKLHPRDTSVYPVDDDIIILSPSFPSELLGLTGYKFKYAVSVCSSAVNTTFAENKINMNENFYNSPEFVLLDIDGNNIEL